MPFFTFPRAVKIVKGKNLKKGDNIGDVVFSSIGNQSGEKPILSMTDLSNLAKSLTDLSNLDLDDESEDQPIVFQLPNDDDTVGETWVFLICS